MKEFVVVLLGFGVFLIFFSPTRLGGWENVAFPRNSTGGP